MILLVTQYHFPQKNAGSTRFFYFARLLQKMGYEVIVIGHGDIVPEVQIYNGIPYISLRSDYSRKSRLLFDKRMIKRIKDQFDNKIIEAIIAGNIDNILLTWLNHFCQHNKIKFIYDVVEWYSPCEFALGRLDYRYIVNYLKNTFFINRHVRVISISSYLNDYFNNKGVKSVRIPIFFDQDDYHYEEKRTNNKLVLAYAGQAGTKDYLNNVFKAIEHLTPESLNKINFKIAGLTETQLALYCQNHGINWGKISCVISPIGFVKRSEVIEMLRSADFTILVRPENERYAKAGFPTKVVESISIGVPVIMNYTSDLGLYFRDGIDCIKLNNIEPDSILEGIMRAIEFSSSQKNEMAINAKKLAIAYFGIESYHSKMKKILADDYNQ